MHDLTFHSYPKWGDGSTKER